LTGTIGRVEAQRVNQLMWRACDRFLVANPATDIERSLAAVSSGHTRRG
jgi:hypothetical protein